MVRKAKESLNKTSPWAVVKFNEEKRVFDTGNIKKMISDDGVIYFGRQRPLPTHIKGKPVQWVEFGQFVKDKVAGRPSAKDLDAVAEEERIKWLTQRK